MSSGSRGNADSWESWLRQSSRFDTREKERENMQEAVIWINEHQIASRAHHLLSEMNPLRHSIQKLIQQHMIIPNSFAAPPYQFDAKKKLFFIWQATIYNTSLGFRNKPFHAHWEGFKSGPWNRPWRHSRPRPKGKGESYDMKSAPKPCLPVVHCAEWMTPWSGWLLVSSSRDSWGYSSARSRGNAGWWGLWLLRQVWSSSRFNGASEREKEWTRKAIIRMKEHQNMRESSSTTGEMAPSAVA